MTDTTFALVALGFAVGVLALWRLVAALRASRSLVGVRLVTCPDTGSVAAVRFSRMYAVVTALRHHEPDGRLAHCSLWAVRGPCNQACVPQAKAPDTALTNVIARWSVERRCVLCGKPLVEASLMGHHITLRSSNGVTTEWPYVAPEALPQALRTRQPACWNCHIAEEFRRRYPGLVTDR